MKYTSAEAGKLVKKLEEQVRDLRSREIKSAVFHAASTEDPEKLRPEYHFSEVQTKLEKIQQDIRTVKHAINVFNTTHTLPGYKNLTIDQVLILIPQLSARKEKLRKMAARLPRERVDVLMSRGNIIDYEIANYQVGEAKEAYEKTVEELSSLQLALDAVNTSVTMEIEIE